MFMKNDKDIENGFLHLRDKVQIRIKPQLTYAISNSISLNTGLSAMDGMGC